MNDWRLDYSDGYEQADLEIKVVNLLDLSTFEDNHASFIVDRNGRRTAYYKNQYHAGYAARMKDEIE